jgi:acyl carrier protein
MEKTKIYKKAFMEVLNLTEKDFGEEIIFSKTKGWDSIGHMQLIAKLEESFDIFLDTDDILNLSSFSEGKSILKKYDIIID